MTIATKLETQMKKCTKCGEVKELSEYHKNKSEKDAHVYRCKLCVSKKSQEYYKKNREKIKKYRATNQKTNQKKYREKNREKIKERDKVYREKNRDIIRARNRVFAREHKEEYREKRRTYMQTDSAKEKTKLRRKRGYEKNLAKIRIKKALKKLGLVHNATLFTEEFIELNRLYILLYRKIKNKKE